jgi:hypothetical protein
MAGNKKQQLIYLEEKVKKKGKRKAITKGISFSKYVQDLIINDN